MGVKKLKNLDISSSIADEETYEVRVLGGHKLNQGKPFFSEDGSALIVPSESSLRLYSTTSGQFQHEVKCHDTSLVDPSDEVFQGQLHPEDPTNLVICFSRKGKMIISEIQSNEHILILDLLETANLGSTETTLTFGCAISSKPDVACKHGKDNYQLNIYFQVENGTQVYQYTIDDAFQGKQVANKSHKRMKNARSIELNSHSHKVEPKTQKEAIKSKMTFSPTGKFIVCAFKHHLLVHPVYPDQRESRNHKMFQIKKVGGMKRFLTCIACHPTEESVATGVSDGSIIIWSDIINDPSCPKRQLHWHPSPVSDLCFSATGLRLFSVGMEAVLVSWDVKTGRSSFRPHLGGPIKMVSVDPSNRFVVLQFEDNKVKILSTDLNDSRDRECEVNEMTFDTQSNRVSQCFYEPNSRSVVLTGEPGKLQFFSVSTGKKTSLEVIPQNFVYCKVPGRENNIQMKITCFAVSPDGSWIASDELRDDGVSFVEERLKIWNRNYNEGRYEENTVIHLPHEKEVTSLKFSQDVKTLISLSKDHTFKIWRKSIASTGRISWTLKTTCFKNNSLLLNDVQISFDSSVAAVIFDTKFITFWKTENGEPVARECCNVNGATSFEVVGVSFATGINSHVFVEVRSDRIRVWNFLKKCLSWTYSSSLMQNKKLGNEFFVNMALDDSTNRIAIYCKDFSILIFDLLDPEPHSIVRDDVLKEQTLTCCLFAPSRFVDHDLSCGSSLLFFNDKRQLIGLIPKGGKTKTKAIESSESMEVDEPTKGSINILGEKVFVDTVLPTEEELRNEGMKQLLRARNVIEAEFDVSRIADLLMVQPPSHILPSIHQLSKTFMTSLFLKRDPPSLQKIKLKRRLHNNETTMRAGDEEDDDSE